MGVMETVALIGRCLTASLAWGARGSWHKSSPVRGDMGSGALGGSGPMRTIVKRLRQKVGDDVSNPTYIFNKPRVGYNMPKGEAEE